MAVALALVVSDPCGHRHPQGYKTSDGTTDGYMTMTDFIIRQHNIECLMLSPQK